MLLYRHKLSKYYFNHLIYTVNKNMTQSTHNTNAISFKELVAIISIVVFFTILITLLNTLNVIVANTTDIAYMLNDVNYILDNK